MLFLLLLLFFAFSSFISLFCFLFFCNYMQSWIFTEFDCIHFWYLNDSYLLFSHIYCLICFYNWDTQDSRWSLEVILVWFCFFTQVFRLVLSKNECHSYCLSHFCFILQKNLSTPASKICWTSTFLKMFLLCFFIAIVNQSMGNN